jgi:hypothetical protein
MILVLGYLAKVVSEFANCLSFGLKQRKFSPRTPKSTVCAVPLDDPTI